jgi:carbonic anhydrase/acetyltransferase-like protein (isoleucine patch superfamily)
VIGSGVNLEAGVVVANHLNEAPGTPVALRWRGRTIETGAAKFGAVIGDGALVGANSVLSPGTVLEAGEVVPRLTLR